MAHEAILNVSRVFGFGQAAEQRKGWALDGSTILISAYVTRYLLLCGLLVVVGHAQQPSNTQANNLPASDRVVLKVGNTKVTEKEFESRVEGIEPHGGDPDREARRGKTADALVTTMLPVLMLSQQALANGLDSTPEVSRKLAIARMQVLSDAEFASLMRQAEPSSEEISRSYSAHLSEYEEVQIRRLFIWKARKSKDESVLSSQDARERADQLRRELASGSSEKTQAANLIKSGEGMLDPEPLIFMRGQLSPAIEKVAFALKEGEWSEVEDTPARLLVIQLVKRDRQTLGQVSAHIEKDLQGQKMQALLDDLRRKAGIWMDEQYFGALTSVTDAQRRNSDSQSELQKSATKAESNHDEQWK